MAGAGARVAGVLAPITTPFDARTGNVVPERMRSNARTLVAAGLDGIVVAGSTGEAPLLEAEEQRVLIAAARDVIPDGRWLIAGTGAESTRATIALTQAAAAEGADAVLVRPPGYFSTAHSPASLVDHFRAVADASPVPVLIYNIPKYTHLPLDPGLIRQLSTHERIVGAKDSSGDAKNLAAYREAAPGWVMLVGSASLLYQGLALGCDGGVVGVACFAAEPCAALVAAYGAGDRARAGAIQEALIPLDREIVGKLGPAGVKAAMEAVGLYGGPVRAPLAPLSPGDRERVARLVTR